MRALPRALFSLAIVTLLTLTLEGCGAYRSLSVYKLDINQGNFVTQDMVDRLKVGQTRQQVTGALGSPLLVDPFHQDRWDYPYEFVRQGQILERRKFTVYFVDDKLARWEGDEAPPPPAELARSGGGDAQLDKSLSIAPRTDDKNIFNRILEKISR
jgi:outer membrane protein assembly factor BamE